MFLPLSVSHSVHRGEYLGRYTPLGRYPTSSRQVHLQVHPLGTPPGRYIPWQVYPRAGTPNQVGTLPPPGTPPTTVHAGIRSTSGQYASTWNAFLSCSCHLSKITMDVKSLYCSLTISLIQYIRPPFITISFINR